jgi:hypothetical protein
MQLTPLSMLQEQSVSAGWVGSILMLQQLRYLIRLALSKPVKEPAFANQSQPWYRTLDEPFSDSFESFAETSEADPWWATPEVPKKLHKRRDQLPQQLCRRRKQLPNQLRRKRPGFGP